MRQIAITNPRKLCFGEGCADVFVHDFAGQGYRRVFILTIEEILPLIEGKIVALKKAGVEVVLDTSIRTEPSFDTFAAVLEQAHQSGVDAVAGIGGGSVLDVAKLVAALYRNEQGLLEVLGIGNLKRRTLPLACLPTTSGTGSEVSPNAILLDPADQLKKGVISPHLVPDFAYVDPALTRTVPPQVTAATGMDALTHCIEAYANKFAHPMIDTLALEGVRLIGGHLKRAVDNGDDSEARAALSLGSLYGGMCLGPVNTAAVHALSYPLGGEFHVPHGISNAVLLPYVLEFNVSAAPGRYAQIARALGVADTGSEEVIARKGIERIVELARQCGIPTCLSELNIPREAIPRMAEGALKVTRLLKNNLRPVTLEDAVQIYERAF